ncbi:MAG: peptide-methionine (S)-S-oxide reductase [Bacteroidetes bacterium SW_11_64_17]|nr:MAG: peptide-methionine (S)-S-oxide reductase [Bacteroidetes bacterium SW_11_64_17]
MGNRALNDPFESLRLSLRTTPAITVSDQQRATLGGGCFWCLEAVYEEVDGISEVVSGYAGGHVPSPTYRQVCNGTTGHAEVVRLTYDPSVIGYRDLLEIFFTIHNPTTENREGADTGPQYRSIILHHNEEQKETAEKLIDDLEANGVFGDPIVTEVESLDTFYRAEDKHQDYYERNSAQPYCQSVISPKVAKLRKKHADKLR